MDQDSPGAEMAALPAYVSACAEVVIFQSHDYDDRAWCQVELMMAFAFMTVGDKIFQIPPGFEHRRQRHVTFRRYALPDPLAGNLTNEGDRRVISELRDCASSSRAFTLRRACEGLFCTGAARAALWAVCCCGWLGLAAWLNARTVRVGRSVVYRLTPASGGADAGSADRATALEAAAELARLRQQWAEEAAAAAEADAAKAAAEARAEAEAAAALASQPPARTVRAQASGGAPAPSGAADAAGSGGGPGRRRLLFGRAGGGVTGGARTSGGGARLSTGGPKSARAAFGGVRARLPKLTPRGGGSGAQAAGQAVAASARGSSRAPARDSQAASSSLH